MDYGLIHVTRTDNGIAGITSTYRVEGDVFCLWRYDLLQDGVKDVRLGARFSVGGVALIVTKFEPWSDYVIAARETAWKWRAYYFIFDRLANWLRMVYGRVIVTLAVWNLARIDYGEIPGFHNILRRWHRK